MRPVRLELSGFTAYREATTVDFAGADLFVLCGPTGSGKSSVIDAICFALYGSVPRYHDPSLIYPVISQGKLEARVRFDFTLADVPYTAVRVVRRQGDRATTREARLESNGKPLAGNVRELNEKITALFGLTFDQFTTCVVLPQGEFARFLHERPADKQHLLRELLGLEIYERMRRLATERERDARQRLARLDGRLEELAFATVEMRQKRAARVRSLERLQRSVDRQQQEIARLESEADRLNRAAGEHEAQVRLLAAVAIPVGVARLGKTQTSESRKLRSVASKLAAAAQHVLELETARSQLPQLAATEATLAAGREHQRVSTDLAAAGQRADAARHRMTQAVEAREQAGLAVSAALDAIARIERRHAAHALASGLTPGDPCPVCLRPIDEPPDHPQPKGLTQARRTLERAEVRRDEALAAESEARNEHARHAAQVTALTDRAAWLASGLGESPPLRDLETLAETIRQAESDLATARQTYRAIEQEERALRERIAGAAAEIAAAWNAFDELRDPLAVLGPPAAARDDLVGSWTSLAEWARERSAERRQTAQAARDAARAADLERDTARAAADRACREHDVDVGDGNPRDAVLKAQAAAAGAVQEIDLRLEAAERLRAERSGVDRDRSVSAALVRHLAANGFERWLLQEAFARLVAAAGTRLRELSRGDYSFRTDLNFNFDVVDHRNADEVRSVRTLSGGETFLASLALALTLADQIGELATDGAAPLESMFLDEGFGTLDPETMDVVATAIEELGARGRTIGLVTHVRELADRIPLQFHVERGPTTARIHKVAP